MPVVDHLIILIQHAVSPSDRTDVMDTALAASANWPFVVCCTTSKSTVI